MKQSLLTIRILFLLLCILASYLFWSSYPEPQGTHTLLIFGGGIGLGLLTMFFDQAKGAISGRIPFAILTGLCMGGIVSILIGTTPLLASLSETTQTATQWGLFLIASYAGMMIVFKGKDDFDFVIPFMKFSPQNIEGSRVVLDSSVLIDGRIATICQSRFLSSVLIVPRFVVDELHQLAESEDPQQRSRGRKGVEALNKLKNMSYIDLRIKDIEIDSAQHTEAKLIYLTQGMKAKLMTTDYNLAKQAEFNGIEWLNINALSKALNPEVTVGQYLDVDLVKPGKEPHQGVGYLSDGSMVVVNEAFEFISQTVATEVISVLPSAGGKMIFARLHNNASEAAA